MKATIDFDDGLYRRLKIEAARRGRTIRDMVEEGVRRVLDLPKASDILPDASSEPEWFGTLREYAGNARDRHDLGDIRESIARERSRRP